MHRQQFGVSQVNKGDDGDDDAEKFGQAGMNDSLPDLD